MRPDLFGDSDEHSGPGEVVDAALVISGPTGQEWSGEISDENGTRTVSGSCPHGRPPCSSEELRRRHDQEESAGSWFLRARTVLNTVEERCDLTTTTSEAVSVSGVVKNDQTLNEGESRSQLWLNPGIPFVPREHRGPSVGR